jgi:hypothetical protein
MAAEAKARDAPSSTANEKIEDVSSTDVRAVGPEDPPRGWRDRSRCARGNVV